MPITLYFFFVLQILTSSTSCQFLQPPAPNENYKMELKVLTHAAYEIFVKTNMPFDIVVTENTWTNSLVTEFVHQLSVNNSYKFIVLKNLEQEASKIINLHRAAIFFLSGENDIVYVCNYIYFSRLGNRQMTYLIHIPELTLDDLLTYNPINRRLVVLYNEDFMLLQSFFLLKDGKKFALAMPQLYSPDNCENTTLIVYSGKDKNDLSWIDSNLTSERFTNFYGCQLTMVVPTGKNDRSGYLDKNYTSVSGIAAKFFRIASEIYNFTPFGIPWTFFDEPITLTGRKTFHFQLDFHPTIYFRVMDIKLTNENSRMSNVILDLKTDLLVSRAVKNKSLVMASFTMESWMVIAFGLFSVVVLVVVLDWMHRKCFKLSDQKNLWKLLRIIFGNQRINLKNRSTVLENLENDCESLTARRPSVTLNTIFGPTMNDLIGTEESSIQIEDRSFKTQTAGTLAKPVCNREFEISPSDPEGSALTACKIVHKSSTSADGSFKITSKSTTSTIFAKYSACAAGSVNANPAFPSKTTPIPALVVTTICGRDFETEDVSFPEAFHSVNVTLATAHGVTDTKVTPAPDPNSLFSSTYLIGKRLAANSNRKNPSRSVNFENFNHISLFIISMMFSIFIKFLYQSQLYPQFLIQPQNQLPDSIQQLIDENYKVMYRYPFQPNLNMSMEKLYENDFQNAITSQSHNSQDKFCLYLDINFKKILAAEYDLEINSDWHQMSTMEVTHEVIAFHQNSFAFPCFHKLINRLIENGMMSLIVNFYYENDSLKSKEGSNLGYNGLSLKEILEFFAILGCGFLISAICFAVEKLIWSKFHLRIYAKLQKMTQEWKIILNWNRVADLTRLRKFRPN